VGGALINRVDVGQLPLSAWLARKPIPDYRETELLVERAVSSYIGRMPLLWVAVPTRDDGTSDRGLIESSSIALLSATAGGPDAASAAWLGKHAPHIAVASSGLWNVRHVADQYEPRTLEVLAAYVEAQPVSETGECQSFELAIRKPEPSSVSARQCRLRYSTQGVSSHCRWRAKKTTRSSIRWNAGPGSATRSTQTMASRQPPTPVPLVERRAETGGAGRSFVPQMQRFAVIVPVGRTSAAGRVVNRLLLRWPMGSLPAGRPQL
jgi:hypothetical protein